MEIIMLYFVILWNKEWYRFIVGRGIYIIFELVKRKVCVIMVCVDESKGKIVW